MLMTKEELLSDLTEAYLVLKPSTVHGIGVFAIRDIPKGSRTMFSKENEDWIKISVEEVESLPGYSKELVKTYCVFDDNYYYVESYGFKKMDLVNFLNHADTPNIIPVNDGEFFEAITEIKCGQELFINYGTV